MLVRGPGIPDQRCGLFVFPSLYEGAGLPILEAMACGAPVIGSNVSSVPEILGDLQAAFDPADPRDIAACIERTLESEAELERRPEESGDPIGDDAHSPVEGIVHRYPDRVLFLTTGTCSTYCRYCTRARAVGNPGGEYHFSTRQWGEAIAYDISADRKAIARASEQSVRRMTAAVGHPTLRLVRVRVGQFALGELAATIFAFIIFAEFSEKFCRSQRLVLAICI